MISLSLVSFPLVDQAVKVAQVRSYRRRFSTVKVVDRMLTWPVIFKNACTWLVSFCCDSDLPLSRWLWSNYIGQIFAFLVFNTKVHSFFHDKIIYCWIITE